MSCDGLGVGPTAELSKSKVKAGCVYSFQIVWCLLGKVVPEQAAAHDGFALLGAKLDRPQDGCEGRNLATEKAVCVPPRALHAGMRYGMGSHRWGCQNGFQMSQASEDVAGIVLARCSGLAVEESVLEILRKRIIVGGYTMDSLQRT